MSQKLEIGSRSEARRMHPVAAALLVAPLLHVAGVLGISAPALAESKPAEVAAKGNGAKEAPVPVDAVPDEEIPAGALPGEEEDMIGFGSHEHGVAEIQVIIDESAFVIDLRLPMMDGAGFEHKPKNDQERKKFADALAALKDPAPLFAVPAGAGCTVDNIEVLEPEELTDASPGEGTPPGAEGGAAADGDQHGDISAVYEYKCTKVADVKSVNVQLFKKFPSLKKVAASYETPWGQGTSELLATSNQLQLK